VTRDTDYPKETVEEREPATPLDTGTAENAQRTEEMAAGGEATTTGRVDDAGAQDEAHARDVVAVGAAAVPQQSSTTAPATEFWPSDVIDNLRGRWDAVQMRFVDDPPGVANDARALVGEAVSAIREAVDRLEARLDEAVTETAEDTEQLRQKVAHYRDVFESLLSR
jgi:hypothetical protein